MYEIFLNSARTILLKINEQILSENLTKDYEFDLTKKKYPDEKTKLLYQM